MTTFEVIRGGDLPKVGITDSKHSFDESMEARVKSQLFALSSIITDRESAWDELEALELRKTSASPSPLSSLTFGTDKSPSSASNARDFNSKPLSADGTVTRRRRREDSGTVCSGSSSPSSPRPHCAPLVVDEAAAPGEEEAPASSLCQSNLGTPVVFQPRQWLMESPNLSSLKIESGESESDESIIHEIAASRGNEAISELLPERAEAVTTTADLAHFPEFHDDDDDDGENVRASECLPDQPIISIPDPHDPLLSYYFANHPHIFAPPCYPYPRVTTAAAGFEPPIPHPPPPHPHHHHHHHPHLQYGPPLSQLQEPIIINVPNQAPDFPPFASSSSCSVGLSSSSYEVLYPPNDCQFVASSEMPLGATYHPEEQRVNPMTQPHPPQHPHPVQQMQLPPHPPHVSGMPPQNRIRSFPAATAHQQQQQQHHHQQQQQHQHHHQQQQQTFVNPMGNLVASVAGPTTAVLFPQASSTFAPIQMMPAPPPNPSVVATPMVCANEPVVIHQFRPDLPPQIVHPPPHHPVQTPFVVSMNYPQPVSCPPPVLAAVPPTSAPPPPPPPPQIMMAQQPVIPIQTLQQHPSTFLFNQVPMIAVDVPAMPCPSMPVPVEQTPPAVNSHTQSNTVRPLMDIKEEKVAAKKGGAKAGCVFCRSNGEREREYMGHRLKNPITNIVECPQLRKFVCPECGATGDAAHTVSYCPSNIKWTGSTVKTLKAMRSSAGKKCGRNVAKTD